MNKVMEHLVRFVVSLADRSLNQMFCGKLEFLANADHDMRVHPVWILKKGSANCVVPHLKGFQRYKDIIEYLQK